MNSILPRLGFAALAIVAGAPVLMAQDATTGAVVGTVIDSATKAPIAGARVILDGGRGQQTYTTDAAGSFRATSLIPGRYNVTVTAPGYDQPVRTTITVSLNVRTPLSVSMSKGVVVEVVATASKIDTQTQTSGTQFASEQFSTLPLGRSFVNVIGLAPGVVDGGGTGAANPSISGGSGLENQYVIDGANTTNAGFGANGAFSRAFGSLGTGINTDFIQEVQVKSFGLDAEYGQTTGAVINAITKTGDNTLRGSVFAYFDFDGLQAKNKVPVFAPGTTPQPVFDSFERQEFGFTVSGPIIKDKLFYFVGYNPIRSKTTSTAPFQADGSSYPLSGRKFDQKVNTDSYYAKLNWSISPSHSLEGSFFGDPGKRPQGPQGAADFRGAEGKFSELKYGTTTYSVKYNGTLAADFLVEARISGSKNTFERIPTAASSAEWFVTDTATGAALAPNAIGFYEKKLTSTNEQYELKVSKFFGSFDLKFGYLYENVKYDEANQRTGPTGFVDPHNNSVFTTGVSIQKRYRVANPALPYGPGNIANYYRIVRGLTSDPTRRSKTKYNAMFLQGNLNLSNRWNIKLGLRQEEQELAGTDITYKFKAADNLAPRFSITWDVDGNGKSKAYFFAGRLFEKIPNDIAIRSLSTERGINRSDFLTLTGFSGLSGAILNGTPIQDVSATTGQPTTSSPTTTHFATTGTAPTEILPGTKSQYTDELLVGYDVEPSPGFTFSTRYIYRSLGRILEDLSYDGDSYYIANPGGNFPSVPGATFPKPERTYHAVQVEVSKRGANWQGFLNVNFSKSEGNYEGLFRNDNGQSDPNITSLYDLPVELLEDHDRGLTGWEQYLPGALPTDRTLVANLGLTYNWSFGLTTGIVARYATGNPITSYYAHPVYENAGEVPLYGRGVEGRLPSTFTLDLSANYSWKLGGKYDLGFRADIFNLLNSHEITAKDTNLDLGLGADNPNYMKVTAYQTARRVRVGVSLKF